MISAREKYISTVKSMLQTMPLDEIRVKDICARTDTNRHTFYYYFSDKYSLVYSIFKETVEDIIHESRDALSFEAGIAVLSNIRRDVQFYKNALTYTGQNALGPYMVDYCFNLLQSVVREAEGKGALNPDSLYPLRFYTYGIVGLIYDWIHYNCQIPEEELLAQIIVLLPEPLRPVRNQV